jgi:nucleotidyltransferase substrate binding protein (TIGR01987 family)
MKDIIIGYHKVLDFATGSPRETLRIAASVKLIHDDSWMQMLDDRNDLAHDYDGALAEEIVHKILEQYLPVLEIFRDTAGTYVEKIG